jgi:hypothetical protein
MFNDVIQNVPGLGDSILSDADGPTSSSGIDFAELLSPLSIAFIVMGSVVGGIALIGFIGACCSSRRFIIIVSAPVNLTVS